MVRSQLAKSTVQTSAVLAGRLAIQALSILLVARLLGAREYGAFASSAALAITLGAMSTFGSHYVLMAAASSQRTQRSSVLEQAVPMTIGIGLVLTITHMVLCRLWLDANETSLLTIACIGIADIVLQPLLWLRSFEVMGSGHAWRSQAIATFAIGMRLIAAFGAWLIPSLHSLNEYAPCHLIATFAGLSLALKVSDQPWPRIRSWRVPDARFFRTSTGYAATSMTSMAPLELDKVVAASLAPLGAAGVYAASARVLAAAVLPVVALMVAALPRLTARPQGKGRLLRAILIASAAYGVLVTAALWALAPLAERVFGMGYSGLATLLQVAAFAAPGLALRIAAGNALIAERKPWCRSALEVSSLAVLTTSAWIFASSAGVIGVARAVVLTESATGVAMAVAAVLAVSSTRSLVDSSR